ncbi:MAG: DNA polymerase III subunit beta [Candidatus Moranbacteria bacterium]|nr:DNA polymerase III subunit beta [Candidatus Moranbacteria bacterium]
MKILSTTDNFKKGILTAEKIIGKNLTLPILSNILLEAERGRLKISATNLEIGIVCLMRAKVEKEGKIAVPGRIIGSFMSNITNNEKIAAEVKDHTLYLSYQGNKASIKGLDAKDFPLIPKPQTDPILEIESQKFQESAAKVLPSAATAETRQELTGVFIGFEEDKLILAATDSFRLAEAVIKLEKESINASYQKYIAKNSSIIVPAKTLQEVARSIGPESGKLKIYIGENQIFFEIDDTLFISRLIDGKYPEYKQVIPKDFLAGLRLKKDDLLRAVRVASIFSDSKSREVKLRAKEGEKKIKIEAQSMESGENVTEVESDATLKGSAVIAFNNRYLIEGLNALSSEEIYIGFNDSFGPVILREMAGEKPREDFLHIIMPIRS